MMHTRRKLLALLLACATALCACGCALRLDRRGAASSSEPTLAEIRDKSMPFTSLNNRFILTAPAGWYDGGYEADYPDASLNLYSGDGAVEMTLYYYPKERDFQSVSLDDFAGMVIRSWEDLRYHYQPEVRKDWVIDGCPARRDGIGVFYDGEPECWNVRLFSLEYPDAFVCMLFGVSYSDLPKAEKTIDIIAKSIRRTESGQSAAAFRPATKTTRPAAIFPRRPCQSMVFI